MKGFRLVLVSILILLLAGCLKDEVGGVRVATDSTVEVYSVPRQTALFLFHAGGPWKASCPASWLKIVRDRGEGGTDTLVVVTTELNLTGRERTTQVTLESEGYTEVVQVRQTDDYAQFDIPDKQLTMPAEGGLLDVGFRTNRPDSLMLYVSVSLADYLVDTRKEDSTNTADSRSEKQGTLKWLKVLPNESDSIREGYFFLSIAHKRTGMRVDLDTLHFRQSGITSGD
jgi:hypothetical protein